MKVVIVGGVAGGASVAARLRRIDEKSEIIILERGKHVSYANCGLPYYIGDVIKDRQQILLQTPESFKDRFNVDVRVENEVLSIDPVQKSVSILDRQTGKEYAETFDKLVLTPGAEPVMPPVPGNSSKRIFTLRDVEDADRIKNFMSEKRPQHVIIVGGGYIGLEMAENLHAMGIFVTLIEMASQVIAPLDYELAAIVHQHLKAKNMEFYLDSQVTAFSDDIDRILVQLRNGKTLSADLVIMSVGVKPEIRLAKNAGLTIGETGGIYVDEFMKTSHPDIYAAGDAIETWDPVFKFKRLIPLAGPANKQARIIANNIVFGDKEKFNGSNGTAVMKVFDLSVGVTGFNERFLKLKKIPYSTVLIHSSSHAGYYPGALPFTLKLNYHTEDGRVLGGQAVGYDGVDKIMEQLSIATQLGMTIFQLKEIEQAYAPPFSSAKAPVNMLGFVAENIHTGKFKTCTWKELLRRDKDSSIILDVRTQPETLIGMIEGAINIPVDELRNRLNDIPKDKKIYVYCAVGLRAYIACRILAENDFKDVYDLAGGYKTWETVTAIQSNVDIYDKYKVLKNDEIRRLDEDNTDLVNSQLSKGYVDIDACGMQCPGPVIKLKEGIDKLGVGNNIRVLASDPGFARDVKSWCNMTGHTLLKLAEEHGKVEAIIRKNETGSSQGGAGSSINKNEKTIIVFNDDFDKVLAAFVIANGARAMGRKMTMFFTFWGLNILKKKHPPKVKKELISKMFGFMMPKDMDHLKLSKMNMGGLGPRMMNMIMKKKKIDTLERLMESALKSGVEIIACQMSMDVMGIKREELIDGIKVGGVAAYLEAAEQSNVNLFI